ncbi:gasdermin-E isoform X1 [Ictalurus punctatus]|uniref:Gasdermin-E isoform X1 n=2 Tax=Ictalurus punctatus TaxID=7998 RepID=A0A9F7RDQ5_ICTPU|nr:gasdermin-E isoform X1 [Ictalurus punctatus]XP_053540277.1 gasdermin-E isoform X1 [Ictalurus punctatus]
MFERVTRNLLHQTDHDGTLIAVSRLNDSEKLKLLAVVIKCPGKWPWQSTKYKPTDFTLNDLLQGKPIQPVLEEKVFLNKYKATQNGNIAGSGEVDMGGVSMKAEGRGTSNILSSLGTLLKESVIMSHFLKDSKDRKVDLQHNLIRQIQRKNQVFTLVKQRIFTSCDCTINFSELKEGSCSALVKLFCPAKVHLKEGVSLKNTTDVAIEIPPHTVVAYSVSELTIDSDGHYEVGVSPDGIEADDSITQKFIHNWTELDGLWAQTQISEGSSLSALNNESEKEILYELTRLPSETRFSLLNLFQEILPDQTLLSTLEDKLEKICDESVYDSHTYLPETSNELTDKFLDLLQSETDNMDSLPTALRPNGSLPAISKQNGSQSEGKASNTSHNGSSQRQLILTAMYILISAAEELTDDGLAFLKTCSSETINVLSYLLTQLTGVSQRVPFSELPFPLRDGEVPQEMKLLFTSSNIILKRDNKELYAEIGKGSKVLPRVLCIVIHGLACLNESCETD